MKKSIMIAALIAASTFAVSAADVYSSNIVGYSKVTLSPGFTMVGAPFQNVGSVTGTVNIQDVVNTTGLVGYDWDNYETRDSITFFDPAVQGYSTTYFWSDADGGYGLENKWFDDNTFQPADIDLPVGSAFFIISGSSSNFVGILAGEVAAGAAGQDVEFGPEFTMIANPFPYALDINADMTPTGLVGYDWDNYETADSLTIFDPAVQGYSTTYFWSDADGGYGLENKWFDDNTFEAATATIPVGGAFFIISSGSGGTIDFAAP